jgi:hypothetical protein
LPDGVNPQCDACALMQHPIPVTEEQKWSAYPGCYALSKVLEECMLEQYYIQYGLNVSEHADPRSALCPCIFCLILILATTMITRQ